MDNKKNKIRRFADNKYSYSDYSFVASSFRKDESNSEFKKSLEEDWNATTNNVDENVNVHRILDQLHHKINLRQVEKGALARFYSKFSKIAAVLLLPALITIAVFSYLSVNKPEVSVSWAEIHSPIGSRTRFQLPDGSVGWLNSGSSIKYPVDFLNNRHVEIYGEAWFDVAHINSSAFRVATPYFDVQVLGTQFNVISYENEATAEVILEQGKVQILNNEGEVENVLIPDEHLVFNKQTNKMIKTSIDSESYSSWKDGLLIFKNEPMTEIARRLERRYSTDIILHGDLLKKSVFRATFQDENLEEICKMLSTVAPIRYEIHQREKLPDYTFSKRTVEMWLINDNKTNK